VKALAKYRVWIALVLVVLISWWVSGFDDDSDQDKSITKTAHDNAANKAARKQTSIKAAGAQLDHTEALAVIGKGFAPRASMEKLHRDPFTVVSFEPPPPPAPPPPKPVAPPLNFKYLGLLREDESTGKEQGAGRAVFLDSGGQLLIAHKGDTLAGQYRVLEINDTNMQLEYTPLAERQTLNFGR
jgi:hypothetical protein